MEETEKIVKDEGKETEIGTEAKGWELKSKAEGEEVKKPVEKYVKEEKPAPVERDGPRYDRNESREDRFAREEKEKLERWIPKTELGKEVQQKKIKTLQEIFDSGRKILEPEIVDTLLQLKTELLDIGQAKGKFGGGKRRAWKQTQKKTKEGNIAKFSVVSVVGNEDGYMGVGTGKAKETLPGKEKAGRKAKLNVKFVERGCGSYDCSCNELHSIPMSVEGKCGSVKIKLIPAPQGTGLVVGDEVKKILKLAGIKDIYSQTFGQTKTTMNCAKACLDALNKLSELK